MDFKALENEVLSLPPDDRARLAHELIESLDSLSEAEVERLWLDEADRRAQQVDNGSATRVPGEEVARKARALLR